MAGDDDAEPSLAAGVGASSQRGGGFGGRSSRVRNFLGITKIGSRVNVEGVRSLNTAFDQLLATLQKVRTEMTTINQLQGTATGAGGGGAGPSSGMQTGIGASNANTGRLSTMISKFAAMNGATQAGVVGLTASTTMNALLGPVTSRFNRNLQESIPISQGGMLLQSQYGTRGTNEWDRVKALGQFNVSRADTLAAQSIGLALGQGPTQVNRFLQQTVAPLVQASGGTLTPSAAAATAGTFMDPMVMRRARSLAIPQARIAGQVQNPLTTAMGYIKDFEKRYGITMNNIDFENLRSVGSSMRYSMKRLYGLSDDAIDTIVQAGLQNYQFKTTPGTGGRTIDFSSGSDLNKLGLSTSNLGLKMFQYTTAGVNRESQFFRTQQGAEVGKLQTDINIENTLGSLEEKFSGLIGPLGEFQKYIKMATTALGVLSGLSLLKGGGFFGGGGGGGGLLGMLGIGKSAATGAAGAEGIAAMGAEGVAGVGVEGAAAAVGGMSLATGAAVAAPIVAAGIGAVALNSWLNSRTRKRQDKVRKKAALNATVLDDRTLLSQLMSGSRHMTQMPNPNNWMMFPGAKEQGQLRVWEVRRSQLMSEMLTELRDNSAFDKVNPETASEIVSLIDFFSNDNGTKYDDFYSSARKYQKDIAPIVKGSTTASSVYRKYFGAVPDPFAFIPVTTAPANELVTTTSQILGKDESPNTTGDPVDDRVASKGATWSNLTPLMRSRLLSMFKASGGRVWLGNGWRSSKQQETMFLSRYVPDPSGDRTYQGKKWKRVRGAPAAPPGSSMHEIGMAADLEGDLDWVQANADQFGLKTFASVNDEKWHVQPKEFPNSRSQYESSIGSSAAAATTATDTTPPILGDEGTTAAAGGGASLLASASGLNYSLVSSTLGSLSVNRRPNGSSASVMSSSAGATSTSAGTAAVAGGTLTGAQIAQLAYNAGFRGQDLVDVVAIAGRESHGSTAAFNGNASTGDLSYGLMQINMKGSLGPANLKRFGITSNEQLFDPQTNLNAAYVLYQANSNTLRAWGGYKGKSNTYATDPTAAAAAVRAAGLSTTGDPMGGGGGGTVINVQNVTVSATLQATGNLKYDANALATATAGMIKDAADRTARRSGA